MVFITIRLVGESEDRLFENIEVDNQISFSDLRNVIKGVTKIPDVSQEIEFRGVKLEKDHPIDSINDSEEFVVKHGDLHIWEKYKGVVDKVLNGETGDLKRSNAKFAVIYHTMFSETGFFDVYPEHDNFQRLNHSKLYDWTYGNQVDDKEVMCKSTEEYFRKLHDEKRGDEDSEFICYFEEREWATWEPNIVAFVKIHGEECITKYSIKFHFKGRWDPKREPNEEEYFCYKLLELIGVGPKCHFIPSANTQARKYPYIATQWEDRFESLENVCDENSLSADVAVQMKLLESLLQISVYNREICGRWKGTQLAAIVDFEPKDDYYDLSDIKNSLLGNCAWNFTLRNAWHVVRDQHDDSSLLKSYKKYLDLWDFSNKIELARDQVAEVMETLESSFKDHECMDTDDDDDDDDDDEDEDDDDDGDDEDGDDNDDHSYSPIKNLNEFIEVLKENLETIQNL